MTNGKEQVNNYLINITGQVSQTNHKLLTDFLNRLKATVNEPDYSRQYTCLSRLKTVANIFNKPMTPKSLNENDLMRLNNTMKDKGITSAKYYRRVLKQYFRLMDKKGFADLIDSDFMRNPKKKNGGDKLVNPQHFWNLEQMTDYIKECKRVSQRQTAWGGLWLSFGTRPHELLAGNKRNIQYTKTEKTLIFDVEEGKTGARRIILEGDEAVAIWELVEPYLNTLKDDDLLFPVNYRTMYKWHNKICEKINIPYGVPRKFYIARKQTLSHFYNSYKLAKASSMAGHVPGSSEMNAYVGLTETQLLTGIPRLAKKTCPNPICNSVNAVTRTNCSKCNSPLDETDYKNLIAVGNENNVFEVEDLKARLVRNEENLAKVLRHVLELKA